MLGNKIEYERMAEAEEKHWWYCSLHERVLRAVQNHSTGRKDIEILDAGCGTGGLLSYLQHNGYRYLQGFDISELAVTVCRSKNLPVFTASLTEVSSHCKPESKDVVISCDALYFLTPEEQKKALEDFYMVLKPGGIMILNLPSLKIFRGTHDMSVGIKERYHHKMLNKLLPQALVRNGYNFRYWPVLLSPFIAFVRTLQRMRIKSGRYTVESDINIPCNFVNKLMKGLMKLELNYLPPINFASSVFIIAQKKNISI